MRGVPHPQGTAATTGLHPPTYPPPFPHFIFLNINIQRQPLSATQAEWKNARKEMDDGLDGESDKAGSTQEARGPSLAQVAHVPSQQAQHIWTQLASAATWSILHPLNTRIPLPAGRRTWGPPVAM